MLEFTIPETEVFDESTSKIHRLPPIDVKLEHSLLTISKWESIWEVPYLSTTTKKTPEQLMSYISLMSDPPLPPEVLIRLGARERKLISDYTEAKMSATWFSDKPNGSSRGPVNTTELIYYMMTSLNIPFECERWHISRLFNLIRICQIKAEAADPSKKNKSRVSSQILSERAALNAKRRAETGSTG